MRVKCLAQEHNPVPQPESSALTIRPPRLPFIDTKVARNTVNTDESPGFFKHEVL